MLPKDYQADPVRDAKSIVGELGKFSADLLDKPRLIALSKVDLLPEDERGGFVDLLRARLPEGVPIYPISAVAQVGLDAGRDPEAVRQRRRGLGGALQRRDVQREDAQHEGEQGCHEETRPRQAALPRARGRERRRRRRAEARGLGDRLLAALDRVVVLEVCGQGRCVGIVSGVVGLLRGGRFLGRRGLVVQHRTLAVVLDDLAPRQLGAALVLRSAHATTVARRWFRGSLRSHLNHRSTGAALAPQPPIDRGCTRTPTTDAFGARWCTLCP